MTFSERLDLSTDEIVRRYQAGESSKRIATDLGCAVRTVFLRLQKARVPVRPVGTVKPFGAEHHNWKGGRGVYAAGYVYLRVRGRRIAEHRYVMERQLGRLLTNEEEVHHINRVRDDNRPENLQVVTKEEHVRVHDDEQHHRFGQRNPVARLTDAQATEIRRRRQQDRTKILDLVREYGVSKSVIKNVLRGRTYRGVEA